MVLILGKRHVSCQPDFVKPSWTETDFWPLFMGVDDLV